MRAAGATLVAIRAAWPQRWPGALRVTLAVTLPLLIGLIAGHPEAGAQASFGALAAMYVPDAPFRYRARAVAAIGAGLTAAVFVGSWVGGIGWTAAAVVAMVATAVISFVCQAAEVPPPRELMLVMALLAATEIGALPVSVGYMVALTAGGALLAWAIVMIPAVTGWHGPEIRALTAGLEAVTGYLDAVGGPAATAARHRAVLAVRRATRVVDLAGAPASGRQGRLAVAVERLLEAALDIGVVGRGPSPRELSDAVRALLPVVRRADRSADGPTPPVSGDQPATHRRLLEAVADVAAPPSPPTGDRTGAWVAVAPSTWSQLGAALARDSVILPGAVRIGVAVGVGVAVGHGLGLAHSYWIGLTVCAVLQGSNITVTRRRVLHRVIGTLAGVGLVYAVLTWNPALIVLILFVALAQAAVELVITVNYGLAVAGVTVLALLLFHVASPAEEAVIVVGARALDTAIGAVLALLLRLLLWPRTTSVRLPQVQARTLRSAGQFLRVRWAPGKDGPQHRTLQHRLQTELLDLRTVQADVLADTLRPSVTADMSWPVSLAIEDLAVLVMSMPPGWEPPEPGQAEQLLTAVDALSRTIEAGKPVTTPGFLPAVPAYPRITAAVVVLMVAVADLTDARSPGMQR